MERRGDTMEDLTLALVTLTSFVLLFVVAIFADRAGTDLDVSGDVPHAPVAVPVDQAPRSVSGDVQHADVA
jgi:hypothetical protein